MVDFGFSNLSITGIDFSHGFLTQIVKPIVRTTASGEALSDSERALEITPLKKGGESSDMEGNSQNLFPRIPNEVTLNKIVPKLSWRDLWALSSVSRAWCHAIGSRQVYPARVHHHAAETLVILQMNSPFCSCSFVLYSIRDNSFHKLPPIPGVLGGFPEQPRSVSSDGKLYVLGGIYGFGSKVYVFDPVGRRQWKQCSGMIEQRAEFACGVMDGKIYVFGGRVDFWSTISESEVYDPKKDTWCQIKPMTTNRYSHRVAILGKEFLVYRGMYSDLDNDTVAAEFLEIYDPPKDEWRLIQRDCPTEEKWRSIQRYWMGGVPLLFMAQGKLCCANRAQELVVGPQR